ncbi:unnamed protein product, partial [marine sediment metagenome]
YYWPGLAVVYVGQPLVGLILFFLGDYELPFRYYPGPAVLICKLANAGRISFSDPGLFPKTELLALIKPGISLDALPADRIRPDALRLESRGVELGPLLA